MKKVEAVTRYQPCSLRQVSLHVTLVVFGWSAKDSLRKRGICTGKRKLLLEGDDNCGETSLRL